MANPAEATLTLKEWATIFGVVMTVGAAFFSGWNYWIQGKVKSITTLWERWDSFQTTYGEHRLEDAKEYATKKEVARAVERLEDKIDRSEERIESSISSLSEKFDRFIQDWGRRES